MATGAAEPAAAVGCGTAGAVDDAVGLTGELLPDGVDRERRAVAEDDLAAGIANDDNRFLPTSRRIVESQRRMLSPTRDRRGEEPMNAAIWEARPADFEQAKANQ